MSALLLVAFFIVNLPDMLQYAVSVGWSPDPAKNCTSTDSSYSSRAVLRFGSLYIFGRLGYIFGRLETNLLNSAPTAVLIGTVRWPYFEIVVNF